mgnify:CR=1 FL=1
MIYSLTNPALAAWLLEGVSFLASELERNSEMKEAIDTVKELWGSGS